MPHVLHEAERALAQQVALLEVLQAQRHVPEVHVLVLVDGQRRSAGALAVAVRLLLGILVPVNAAARAVRPKGAARPDWVALALLAGARCVRSVRRGCERAAQLGPSEGGRVRIVGLPTLMSRP